MITAAPDTTLQDGRAVCVIRASQLEPGDTITADAAIDIHVQRVGGHPMHPEWVWVDYSLGCGGITGSRGMVSASFVCIAPRTDGEAH